MNTVKLDELNLLNCWHEGDEHAKYRAGFPFYSMTGTESSSVVYFELEPGSFLGTHQDSAEEIVIVLQGTVEVTLGEEKGIISKGEMALIPEMVPHSVRNIGTDAVKVVGFFSSPSVVSTFDQPLMPLNQQVAGAPQIPVDEKMNWNEIMQVIMRSS